MARKKKIKLECNGKTFTFALAHAQKIFKLKGALNNWRIAKDEPFILVNNDIKPRPNKEPDKEAKES